MTALIEVMLWYWLTCSAEVVHASFIPSQAAVLMAYRVADVQAAA